MTIDRFAEKYTSMNPYQYGANNPIKFIDVNGDSYNIAHSLGKVGLGSPYYKDKTGRGKGFIGSRKRLMPRSFYRGKVKKN